MEWFSLWWQDLDMFTQAMYCVAIPATLVLLIQTVMILLGFAHGGAGVNPSDTSGIDGFDAGDSFDTGDVSIDTDVSDGSDIDAAADGSDGSSPSDMGTMHFFSVQGIISFLTVFSWAGIITYGASSNVIISVAVGLVLGFTAMFLVAKILQLSRKLAQNGTLNMNNLIGASGTVYLIIPAAGSGHGKVNVTVGERLVEFDAITDDGEPLPNGARIRVIDIRTGNMLVVEKATEV